MHIYTEPIRQQEPLLQFVLNEPLSEVFNLDRQPIEASKSKKKIINSIKWLLIRWRVSNGVISDGSYVYVTNYDWTYDKSENEKEQHNKIKGNKKMFWPTTTEQV